MKETIFSQFQEYYQKMKETRISGEKVYITRYVWKKPPPLKGRGPLSSAKRFGPAGWEHSYRGSEKTMVKLIPREQNLSTEQSFDDTKTDKKIDG